MKAKMTEDGFSLIEILVASALLAVAILWIIASIPNGYRAVTRAGKQSELDHLAYDKMDELKRISENNWSATTLNVGTHPNATDDAGVPFDVNTQLTTTAYPFYSLEWTVASGPMMHQAGSGTAFETDDQIKIITVTASFKKYDTDGTTLLDPTHQPDLMSRSFSTVIASGR